MGLSSELFEVAPVDEDLTADRFDNNAGMEALADVTHQSELVIEFLWVNCIRVPFYGGQQGEAPEIIVWRNREGVSRRAKWTTPAISPSDTITQFWLS